MTGSHEVGGSIPPSSTNVFMFNRFVVPSAFEPSSVGGLGAPARPRIAGLSVDSNSVVRCWSAHTRSAERPNRIPIGASHFFAHPRTVSIGRFLGLIIRVRMALLLLIEVA